MGEDPEPAARPDARAEWSADRGWRPYLGVTGSALVTLVALGSLFLLPYWVHDFRFPVGFDAPYYVWRAHVTAADGLDPIGTVRAGMPLLLATLMGLTGQNGLTLVVVVPVILVGVAGLGGAAMVRAGTGVGARWVPVLASMTWLGFGRVGMIGGHHDNVLNAALVLPAFAAACLAAAGERGAAAVAILLTGAGLAHWPFHLYAVAILLFGLALFFVVQVRRGERDFATVSRILAATLASGAFTALTFLAPPPQGGIGLKLVPDVLRQRFLNRLGMFERYVALPLAIPGAVVMLRDPVPSGRARARRFLVCLLAAWMGSVVVGGLLQFGGVPVAGARLLNYFFVVPVLAGVACVWAASRLAGRGTLGRLVAAVALLAVVAVFGRLVWGVERTREPWMESAGVDQAASAGAYVSRYAPGREALLLLSVRQGISPDKPGHRWNVVLAAVPPDQVARTTWSTESPREYLSLENQGGSPEDASSPVVLVVKRYNQEGFREAVDLGAPLVAPEVAVLQGPAPIGFEPPASGPRASTSPASLAGIGVLVVAALFLSGSGWSAALLPADPVLRVTIAPALGTATLCLAALAWDRVGLGLWGLRAIGPLALSAGLGWSMVVLERWRRARGSRPTPTERLVSVEAEAAPRSRAEDTLKPAGRGEPGGGPRRPRKPAR
ncbi:MAG TPA: hypothetical protein VGR49_05405 [Actinomycetota bacterium]|nr:hypothetical protein [Actinomycetota bacterium]